MKRARTFILLLLPAVVLTAESAAAGKMEFGAVYLDLEWCGSATVTLAGQTFALPETQTPRRARHQLLVFDAVPAFGIASPSEDFRIGRISLRIVRF